MASSRKLVLVVDDEAAVAESHAALLRDLDYRTEILLAPLEVASRVAKGDVDLVLLDIRMPDKDGLAVLREIKERAPHVGVIMATVINDIEKAVYAIKNGAYNYLLKPVKTERLQEVLHSYLNNRPAHCSEDPRFQSFITQSQKFAEIFRRILAFSDAVSAVLIEGESGTGKELIANISHAVSTRAAAPFLAVNAAALSPQLFESELFGYVKGAFTGAIADRSGYFEAVGNGTLFLDEIGEIGVEQQKSLLRVLQSGKFTRVGDTKEKAFKGRILCATNQNLQECVAQGKFRKDLYFRISSHIISLPPLRERTEDIELLCNFFLQKYCSQYGRSIDEISPEALFALTSYSYPGNVRELEGLISAAVLLEQSPTLQIENLPSHLDIFDKPEEPSEDLSMDLVRYKAVQRALDECEGNHSRAAEKLGIGRATLYRLLRKFRDREGSSTTQ